jgi:hypothetical protein
MLSIRGHACPASIRAEHPGTDSDGSLTADSNSAQPRGAGPGHAGAPHWQPTLHCRQLPKPSLTVLADLAIRARRRRRRRPQLRGQEQSRGRQQAARTMHESEVEFLASREGQRSKAPVDVECYWPTKDEFESPALRRRP